MSESEATSNMDYLFSSEEFESDSFHAPKFVAKYRRVSSLDSLKEQLRNYSENLKHQLFVIINRDYRDFIGIATKLDGVDTRVEMLRRPLLDLRMNMSSLHDWLLSCLNIIEKKVNLRTRIKRQKMVVQCALSCLDKLDLAESILDININPSAGASTDNHDRSDSDTRALTAADTPMKKRSNTATSASELDNNNNTGNIDNNTNKNGTTILRTDMLNRLHRLRKRSSTTTNRSYSANGSRGPAYPSLDLFYASELERAAFILAESIDELDTIRSTLENADNNTNASSLSSKLNHNNSNNNTNDNDKKADGPMSHVASGSNNASTYRVLLDRHERLCNRLVTRIQSWLEEMIVDEIDSEVSNLTDLDQQIEALQSRTHTHKNRCIVHCLRALVVLNKGEVAEIVVAQTLQSHIDAVLTVGRLDGNGGRGTYSGLKETLCGLLSKVNVQMRNTLLLAELPSVKSCRRHSTRSTVTTTDDKDNHSAMDLLVGGVWHPITKTLVEKFPSVLSTGIASILAKCFTAMQSFHEAFSMILGEGYASQIYDRLQQDKRYKALQEKWKLDLYFQLRSGELCTRLDMACQRASTEGWMVSVAGYLYNSTNNNSTSSNTEAGQTSMDKKGGCKTPAGSKKEVDNTSSNNNLQPSTLTMQEVQDYLATLSLKQTFSMNIPLLEVFALEMAIPFHDSVYFKQLGGKMLSLSLRTLKRLEAHIVILTNIATANFPQGAAAFTDHTLDSLGGRISLASTTAEKEEVPMTPAKMPLTPERTPGTIPQTPGSAGGVPVSHHAEDSSIDVSTSIEELGLILIDVNTLKQWVQSIWAPLVHAKLQVVLIDTCNNAVNKLDDIATALWSKATKMLISACKDNLKGVKGITSRYRMTNKPAPSSASDYVDTILNPLRDFLGRYESSLVNFFPRGVWDIEIIKEVNISFTFYLKSVIETVKNMDSTLQRRARNTQKGGLSDSEKIMMQLKLDVKAYKTSISALNIDLSKVDNVSMLDVVE